MWSPYRRGRCVCVSLNSPNETPTASLPLLSTDRWTFPVSPGPQPHLQHLGRPRARGHLAEERQGAGVRRTLHPQVRLGQVRQLHHHRREHGRHWQVQHPGEEQVRHGERGLHRKCLHARRGARQEKVRVVQIASKYVQTITG